MIKYNRKWCLKHCPYIKGNKKFKWTMALPEPIKPSSGRYFEGIFMNMGKSFFCTTIKGNKNPICISDYPVGLIFENDLEEFIKENVDMEEYAKNCPVYMEMLMENWK